MNKTSKMFLNTFIFLLISCTFLVSISASNDLTTKSKYSYSYYSSYIVYGQPNANGMTNLISVRNNSGCPEEYKINFELKVNSIASFEKQIENAVGHAAALDIVTLALAYTGNPAAFATLLASYGYSASARNLGVQLLQSQRDANVYFHRLYQYRSIGYNPGCSLVGNIWICPSSLPLLNY